jgi:hypothetical protein
MGSLSFACLGLKHTSFVPLRDNFTSFHYEAHKFSHHEEHEGREENKICLYLS